MTKSNSESTPSPLPASVVEGERGDEARHTAGPWSVGYEALDVLAPSERGGTFKVCDIRGWGYLTGKGVGALGLSHDDAKAIQVANAHLIAAAPDMYMQHCANAAVLEYLVNAIDANEPLTVEMFDKIVACHKRSQSALTKARAA